jgi:phage protein U
MYAQLGIIRFEGLRGFSSLEQSYGVNYVQHERIGGKPRLEAVGDVLDTLSFDMYLHSSFTDPEAEIEAMRVAMVDREILSLVLGNGTIVGNFVITNFSKTTTFTDPQGNLIEATISVELLESFNDEPLTEAKKAAINQSFATSERNANVRSTLPPKLSPATVVSADIVKIETSGKLTQQYIDTATANPQTLEFYSGKIQSQLDQITTTINTVQSALSNSQALLDLATSLPSALNSVETAVQNMVAIFPVSDTTDLKSLSSQLNNQILSAKSASIGISNQSIVRRL